MSTTLWTISNNIITFRFHKGQSEPRRPMSTNAKQLTKNIEQPTKGVGCKLDPDIYHGITTGLIAGRTVADLSPSTVSRHPSRPAMPLPR